MLHMKTQSNRVSDFRDFVCSLFPKAILFGLYTCVLVGYLGGAVFECCGLYI